MDYGIVQYSPSVVYDDVQLESVEPAHIGTPHERDAIEKFMVGNTLVSVDLDRGRFYEEYPGAFPPSSMAS
jgi:hypothetical protein